MLIQRVSNSLGVCLLLVGVVLHDAHADVIRVSGTVTAVTNPVAGSAVTVLDFEIPPFRVGEGLEIVSASIDWDHGGLAEHSTVRYTLFDPQKVSLGGRLSPTAISRLESVLAEDAVVSGVVYPQDHRRLGKGNFQFMVDEQVQQAVETHRNFIQVVLATQNMSPAGLADSGGPAPVLTIRYGFLGNMKDVFTRPHQGE